MRRWKSGQLPLAVVGLALLLGLSAALAQGRGATLGWWTADGGGGNASGGSYTLSGTLGQADAGQLSGGAYTLSGGFWGGAATHGGRGNRGSLYLPLIAR